MLGRLGKRLNEWKWRVVHARLARERDLLLNDRAFAGEAAKSPLYASLGEWLPEVGAGRRPRILELGCGDGKFVALLGGLGYEVVGVDPIRYPAWEELAARDGLRFEHGIAAESLPFEDGEFDAVVCLGALLYFSAPETAMAEVTRVLGDRGRLVLRTVNRRNLYTLCTGKKLDPASKNLYTLPELEALLAGAGLVTRGSYSFGFWPPILTDWWWFLANTVIGPLGHRVLSRLTPAAFRVNWVVYAEKAAD